jgi:mannose-6-phosphate isomerase-like protein (cupin superfamily)
MTRPTAAGPATAGPATTGPTTAGPTTGPVRAARTAAGQGEAWWFFDSLMVARTDEAGGGPVVIEATVAPGGGAPLHVHAGLDDSFYLVTGRLAMRCGDESFVVEPGGYVSLPHGVPHTFRVVGDEPAVMLQVHADDSFLRFVRAIGRPAPSHTVPAAPATVDLDEAFRVAAETGQPVIGPPMGEAEAAEILAAAGG